MIHDDEPPDPNHKEPVDDWIDLMLHSRPNQSGYQHDLPDPQLLRELQALSREQAQAVHRRVERVWQQLEARARLSADGQRRDIPPARPAPLEERRPPMKKPTFLVQATQYWSARLSALAAALLLVALVGGLIVGLVLVRHSGGQIGHVGPGATATHASTPLPSPTATPEGKIVPVLDHLTMLDAQHGWAINDPVRVTQTDSSITISTNSLSTQVLITSDGGKHWRDVTPPALLGLPLGADFVSPSVAWLFIGNNLLYGTADGGQTWQRATLPDIDTSNDVKYLTFINAQDGWVLLDYLSLGVGHPPATSLFRTTNGGQSWEKLQSTDAQGNNSVGNLSLKHIEWLDFVDPSTGWVGGEDDRSAGALRLYVTHDGGATWQPQIARLPTQGFSGSSVDTLAPQFFNAREGILEAVSSTAVFQPETARRPKAGVLGQVIYSTHDGGATWQSGGPLPEGTNLLSFADVNHGWAASSDTADLWATTDGGRTWTKIASGSLAAYAGGGGAAYSALDFVSPQIGWAERGAPDYSTLLLKTTDGGRTWTQIAFSISG